MRIRRSSGPRRPASGRGDSTLPVDVKVESLRTDLRLQGGIDLSYDPKEPGGKMDEPDFAPMGDIYKLESQVAYTVVLDGQNKVKAIKGTEKLRKKRPGSTPSREQVRSLIEAAPLKAQFEQEHRNLPDGPVKPGESWERTEIVGFRRPAAQFPQEIRVRGHRETRGQDARQDHGQGPRGQMPARTPRQLRPSRRPRAT